MLHLRIGGGGIDTKGRLYLTLLKRKKEIVTEIKKKKHEMPKLLNRS